MNQERLLNLFQIPPIFRENRKFYFIQGQTELVSDNLDKIKSKVKKFSKLYYFAVDVLSPVYLDNKILNRHLSNIEGVKINLGSGNKRLGNGIINLDFMPYENVDIVADIHNLPFKDNSVDCFINIAVLEHVKNPSIVLGEIYRALKPDGFIISVVPFMQPFHASPHDYQRYTLPGLIEVHKMFNKVDCGVISGPVSGFLWVFQELVATILSFGNEKLRSVIYILLLLITFPIKYLDIVFNHYQNATVLASNHFFVGRKS